MDSKCHMVRSKLQINGCICTTGHTNMHKYAHQPIITPTTFVHTQERFHFLYIIEFSKG